MEELDHEYDVFVKEANTYFQQKNYQKSYKFYTQALFSSTTHERLVTTYFKRSQACLKMNKLDDALLDINKAIHLKQTAKAFFIKGIILKEMVKYDQSLIALNKAVILSIGTQKKEIIKHRDYLIKLSCVTILLFFGIISEARLVKQLNEQVEYLNSLGVSNSDEKAFLLLGLYHGIPRHALFRESVQKWILFGEKYGVGRGSKVMELLRDCISSVDDMPNIIEIVVRYYSDNYLNR
jgi:tetratricopeptide (TPR) repeat protein